MLINANEGRAEIVWPVSSFATSTGSCHGVQGIEHDIILANEVDRPSGGKKVGEGEESVDGPSGGQVHPTRASMGNDRTELSVGNCPQTECLRRGLLWPMIAPSYRWAIVRKPSASNDRAEVAVGNCPQSECLRWGFQWAMIASRRLR
jgi:hypothetical protein